MSNRRVVFVVGSGRSGTSTMAGTLRTLGLHVPQPEVVADATNPKGFGEPRWVVDLHHELLQRSNVQVSDARPRAWLDTGTTSGDHATRERVAAWLEDQFAVARRARRQGPARLVVPRPVASRADRCDATSSYVTMLRPVTEVVGSKQTYYGPRGQSGAGSDQGDVTRTAAWVNMMLHTERATRGQQRAVRPLRRPARRLDAAGLRARRGLRPPGREDRDGRRHRRGAPLHRPLAAPGDDDVGRHRCAGPAARARRRDLAGARRDRRRRLGEEPRSGCDQLRAAYASSTPTPRRSPTRPSWPSGAAPPPTPVATPSRRHRRAAPPTGCPTPYARWCRPRPGRSSAGRWAGSAPGIRLMPDIASLEGDPAYDVTWPWTLRRAAGARADVRLPGAQRGAQPAVGAAADLRRGRSTCCSSTTAPTTAPPTWRAASPRSAARPSGSPSSDYPHRVARAGGEHLATPATSVHSLTHFYNWCFSHVRTTYSMKWDGDMVLTPEGAGILRDLSWQLQSTRRSWRCRATR